MKKLFSLVTLVFLAMILMGCQEDTSEIERLEEALETKQNLIEGYETTLEDKVAAIAELKAEIAVLKEENLVLEGYDGAITITVNLGTEEVTRFVHYYEDADVSLWDLLNATFDVDYLSTDWGKQIVGIQSLDAPYGSYIAFYINDEFAMTGVESTDYHHEDRFYFTREWWDDNAELAYNGLSLMLDDTIDQYIDTPNYHVIVGLSRLGLLDNDTIDLSTDLPDTVGGLIQRIMIENALGINHTASTEALYELKTVGHLYSTSLVYAALKTNDQLDLDHFESNLFNALNNANLSETDLDTLSMMLIALSYFDSQDAQDLVDDIVGVIETKLYDSGYADNAATFANVIVGLLSVDVNPLETGFKNNLDENLLEVFVAFQNTEGIFNWTTEPDPMFSTPQAFLALVMIQEYIQSSTGSNPYIFD